MEMKNMQFKLVKIGDMFANRGYFVLCKSKSDETWIKRSYIEPNLKTLLERILIGETVQQQINWASTYDYLPPISLEYTEVIAEGETFIDIVQQVPWAMI